MGRYASPLGHPALEGSGGPPGRGAPLAARRGTGASPVGAPRSPGSLPPRRAKALGRPVRHCLQTVFVSVSFAEDKPPRSNMLLARQCTGRSRPATASRGARCVVTIAPNLLASPFRAAVPPAARGQIAVRAGEGPAGSAHEQNDGMDLEAYLERLRARRAGEPPRRDLSGMRPEGAGAHHRPGGTATPRAARHGILALPAISLNRAPALWRRAAPLNARLSPRRPPLHRRQVPTRAHPHRPARSRPRRPRRRPRPRVPRRHRPRRPRAAHAARGAAHALRRRGPLRPPRV